ncbi:hypothetical protein VNO77_27099 [Canavalia gladiata]|uniref:Uncharacterized protein n=1 Tax=Canavalia gladiata TaxID=3824 RepID=A0AAN9KY84_CANGL
MTSLSLHQGNYHLAPLIFLNCQHVPAVLNYYSALGAILKCPTGPCLNNYCPAPGQSPEYPTGSTSIASFEEIFKIFSWTDEEPRVYFVWRPWTMLRPMLRPLDPDSFHCSIYCTASRPHNNQDSEFVKMSFGAEIWPLKSLVSHRHWHICVEHSGLLIFVKNKCNQAKLVLDQAIETDEGKNLLRERISLRGSASSSSSRLFRRLFGRLKIETPRENSNQTRTPHELLET